MQRWWGALCLSVVLAGASTGEAQKAPAVEHKEPQGMSEARALFMAGRVAFDEGRYEAALKHFEASYEQSQRPLLLYNIAQCYDRMRRDEDAIGAFERYLAAEPDAENRASVEARVRALRAAVAARTPAPATQAEVLPDPTPSATPAAPIPVVVASSSEAHVQPRWWLQAPAISVASGALLAVTGGILMGIAGGQGRDVEHAKVGSGYHDLQGQLDTARHEWVAGQVLLGVGGAVAAGGLVWWLLERREREPPVQVALTPTSVQLGGRF